VRQAVRPKSYIKKTSPEFLYIFYFFFAIIIVLSAETRPNLFVRIFYLCSFLLLFSLLEDDKVLATTTKRRTTSQKPLILIIFHILAAGIEQKGRRTARASDKQV
jgi:hypothetical protein